MAFFVLQVVLGQMFGLETISSLFNVDKELTRSYRIMVILVPGARSYVLWQGSRYLALVTLRRVIPGTEVSNRQRLSFCADTLRNSRGQLLVNVKCTLKSRFF